MSDVLQDNHAKMVLLPESIGKEDYTSKSSVTSYPQGSAAVTTSSIFTDDKAGDQKGLTSGLVTWAELSSSDKVKDDDVNNEDFKAVLSMATPSKGNLVGVVALDGLSEFAASEIIGAAFKRTKTFSTGDIPMFLRPLEDEMGERDVARAAGVFSVELSQGKIKFEQKAAFRNFNPQFLYVPRTARATMKLQSEERKRGQAENTEYFGHPCYTNAKQLTFSSAIQMFAKSTGDKTYVAMMNQADQASSAYGLESPHDLSTLNYTGTVVRFQHAKRETEYSSLSLDTYDDRKMADERVEKDSSAVFSASETFKYTEDRMPFNRWEGTRKALLSTFHDVAKPVEHKYKYSAFYNIGSNVENTFTFHLKVCKGLGCGFLLSADGDGVSSAARFTASGSMLMALFGLGIVMLV
eukprot:GHVS01017178.1.p1 GENE.GHVS01017178.1~~GHVS01017178.1.p1  ORF type:complete len:420 (+),score=44.53 GHVS01017178.1:34-1260(+)